MTAKKFMIGGSSVYHEASSPDSGYDMETSLLGLKMETEDQENVEEDEDEEEEEDDECEDSFGDMNEIRKAKDIKRDNDVSSMVNKKHENRKHGGHISSSSARRQKRYSRARSSRARSPSQVR
jgi:hypothetical protein